MSVIIRWYAVAYPSERLHTINDAMRREECPSSETALAIIAKWREENPSLRYVVRREVDAQGLLEF